jgi:adenylate cyclase
LSDTELKQRLAAILAADVAGYSRLMSADERATVAALDQSRAVFRRWIESNQGRVVDMAGDSVLAVFETAGGALSAARAIQKELGELCAPVPEGRRMRYRIGVHLGDVMEKPDGTVYGDGVNIAARLEGIAVPGGISVSEAVQVAQRNRLHVVFEDQGEHEVKNIAHPVRAFRIREPDAGEAPAAARSGPALALPDKPSIVVLPFDNMSKDPDQEFFADGVVEAITATLSRIRSFFVIARNSAFLYKGRAIDVQQVGRDLGVRYLLEGSVQKAGNRLRITVQLIDATNGAHVWADRVDGSLEDVFDLQDRITERVAGALQPSIRLAEIERARRKRPQDLGAYDYTMRAMPHVWLLEKDACAKALGLLQKAIEIDPDYPLAHSLAGWCHAQRSVYNFAEDIVAARRDAQHHAEKAVEVGGGDDPLILAVLGAVHTFLGNKGSARLLLERAVALDPNAAWAWSRLAWLENYSDQPERAIELFERALRQSPLDPMNFNNYVGIASAHEIAGRYDEAVAQYRRALQERPQATWLYRHTVASLAGAGRMDEVAAEMARLLAVYPDYTISKFIKAMVFTPAALERIAANLRKAGLPE